MRERPAGRPRGMVRAVAGWAAFLGVAACLAGCDRPPRERLAEAERAMIRAGRANGVTRAPEVCGAAQAALVHAEAEVRVQAKRSIFYRDYDEANLLTAEAHREAELCAMYAIAARERASLRAAAALDDLQAWIGRVSGLARHAPASAGLLDDILKAEISLGEGRGSFAREEYERAEGAVTRGRAQLTIAVAGLDAYFDEFLKNGQRGAWKRWVVETLAESRRRHQPIILVDKLRRQLLLIRGEDEIASYAVDLGAGGIAGKTRAGDDATPDGRYRVVEVRGPGQTHYYRALLLDYPNAEDRARFRRLQRAGHNPPGLAIGSLIEIHGHGGRGQDWTKGCVALDNEDMDDLMQWVEIGTPVTIVGAIPEGVLP